MTELKNSTEKFILEGKEKDFHLLQFWSWAMSDLLDNVNRGILAEFIVAKALEIELIHQRTSWAPYDLETTDGIKIEVKSSAYIQSWKQKKISYPSFRISKTKFYNVESNTYSNDSRRRADLYIFALLNHKEKLTINPMNLDQWSFYPISTQLINEFAGDKKTISLKTIEQLEIKPLSFIQLSNIKQKLL